MERTYNTDAEAIEAELEELRADADAWAEEQAAMDAAWPPMTDEDVDRMAAEHGEE